MKPAMRRYKPTLFDFRPIHPGMVCDHHDLPLAVKDYWTSTGRKVEAWHTLVDPEGIEGTRRIPCPVWSS